MYTTDREHTFAAHKFAEELLPGHNRSATLSCREQFGVIGVEGRHSGTDHQHINVTEMIGAMATLHHYSCLLQSTCRRRLLLITACYALASELRHLCNGGNTLSAYTHEMYA